MAIAEGVATGEQRYIDRRRVTVYPKDKGTWASPCVPVSASERSMTQFFFVDVRVLVAFVTEIWRRLQARCTTAARLRMPTRSPRLLLLYPSLSLYLVLRVVLVWVTFLAC
jgi:hypothetical protein